jgi:hypothetical protein
MNIQGGDKQEEEEKERILRGERDQTMLHKYI